MKRTGFIIACLVVATLAVYWRVQTYDFVLFDDPDHVARNTHVNGGITREGLGWAFSNGLEGNWIPLTSISYMVDSQFFGPTAGAYHRTNLLLHAINAVVLFGLFARMTAAPWRSAFVAFAFALHPLHVESVAWISERKDVLFMLPGLLAVWAYAGYARHGGAGRYWLAAVLFSLGLMAKPMLVTLPFLLLLLDYWPLGRVRFPRRGNLHQWIVRGDKPQSAPGPPDPRLPLSKLIWEKLPLLGPVVFVSVVTVLAQQSAGAVVGTSSLPLASRVANALVCYVGYLGKMIWPADLCVYYPHPALVGGRGWSAWAVLGSVVLLAGISWMAYRARRTRPYLLVGWLWYLAALAPVIGLVQVGNQSMADRYVYLPAIGIYIAVAFGISELLVGYRYRKGVLAFAALLVLGACAACTWRQVGFWKDSKSLFAHALDVTWANPVAHNGLGMVLLQDGQIEAATVHFRQAVEIDPRHVAAQFNLANLLLGGRKTSEAIEHYRRAVALNPKLIEAHYRLGSLLLAQAQYDQAEGHFRAVLQTDPDHLAALNDLSWALSTRPDRGRRQVAEAVALAQRASALERHQNAEFLDTLAVAYAAADRFTDAIRAAQQAIDAFLENGDPEGAAETASRLARYKSQTAQPPLSGRPLRPTTPGRTAVSE